MIEISNKELYSNYKKFNELNNWNITKFRVELLKCSDIVPIRVKYGIKDLTRML